MMKKNNMTQKRQGKIRDRLSMLKKIDYAISSYKRAYRHQDAEGIAAYELGKLFQDKWKKNKSDSESRTKAANWYEKHVEMHDNVGGHGYKQYQESLLFFGLIFYCIA